MKAHKFTTLALLSLFFLLAAMAASAEDLGCVGCHEALAKGKSVHQAVSMGCTTCHSGIDPSRMPHRITNKNAKGLSSRQRDLCYDCHDRSQFSKNTVHSAMMLGCTSCHNPHASKDAKLLVSNIRDLCFNCHEESQVTARNTHPPVKGLLCTGCHNPHATDTPQLLTGPYADHSSPVVMKR